MRVKQLWNYLPLPSHIRLVWDRITTSHLTIAYFIFSFCHFVTQVAFQSKAFAINQEAATFLYDVVLQGNTTTDGFAALGDDLRICETAPPNFSTESCRVVWNGTPRENSIAVAAVNSVPFPATTVPVSETVSSAPSITPSPTSAIFSQPSVSGSVISVSVTGTPSIFSASPSATLGPLDNEDAESVDSVSSDGDGESSVSSDGEETSVSSDDNDLEERWALLDEREEENWKILSVLKDGQIVVKLNGMGYDNTDAYLDKSCLWALNWPVIILHNTKREDIVFICFQVWVLGMSVVALLNESIPHIVAALVSHLLATIWSAFQISHTAYFRADYNRLITNGACQGTRLLTGYWTERAIFEIIALSFNVVFLLLSAFFTYRLAKLFGWQTFKRIGASRVINRVYKIVLSLSIIIQVGLFFMAVTVGLWIDQLYNGAIGHLATMHVLYKAMFIITIILLVPWIISGWVGSRKELKWCILVFLAITIWYMSGLSSMFFATTFRWTFIQWRFFGVMVCASMICALLAFVFGLLARWNFGSNLNAYLQSQEPLPDDFTPVSGPNDVEKFNFPSNEKPIPTFSATFGEADSHAFVPPSEWKLGPSHGPRFYSSSTEPIDRSQNISPVSTISSNSVTAPGLAYIKPRSAANESYGSVAPLQRYSNISTDGMSHHYRSNSQASSSSTGSMSRSGMSGKRWVIEE